MWRFLELSQVTCLFPISLYVWGLFFCLRIYWLTMPVGHPMALFRYKGIRDKIIRRKPVRWELKRRAGRKQEASEMSPWRSDGGVLSSVSATLHVLYGQRCAADETALERAWTLTWEGLKPEVRWEQSAEQHQSLPTGTAALNSPLAFVVLQRYLLE